MEQKRPNPLVTVALLAFAYWATFGQGSGCNLPIIAPTKVDRVTYVHDEKAALPSGVLAGIAELNTKGITATNYPDDTTDGDGDVPDQYKIALPAAKAVGIPALVVQSGDKVVRTIKGPTTKAQVLEAAQ